MNNFIDFMKELLSFIDKHLNHNAILTAALVVCIFLHCKTPSNVLLQCILLGVIVLWGWSMITWWLDRKQIKKEVEEHKAEQKRRAEFYKRQAQIEAQNIYIAMDDYKKNCLRYAILSRVPSVGSKSDMIIKDPFAITMLRFMDGSVPSTMLYSQDLMSRNNIWHINEELLDVVQDDIQKNGITIEFLNKFFKREN